MRNILKRHWRILIPITFMAAAFIFSASPSINSSSMSYPISQWLGISHALTRKIAHFILFSGLGASWYYYLRALNIFTPGFTFLGSLLLSTVYASLDEFHQTFVFGRTGRLSDVLLDSAAALTGIIIFATIYYCTRTKSQKAERRRQVDIIWSQNSKLWRKITHKPTKKGTK